MMTQVTAALSRGRSCQRSLWWGWGALSPSHVSWTHAAAPPGFEATPGENNNDNNDNDNNRASRTWP